ncbi:nucleotidyltransferase family protein [Cryobacterium sp. SO2]|uniref:nucleotidyltransferase family protein n=1 Tax=Cryobacterium sp. SO2 TaxID=1897060 RepID=UPI00223E60B5|nr:nucleotidyltransferase family protein [Cryobacterium sp. SO2]WEO78037.1 nucleotidyltransferase family protein [Cryobacterium sp. SO2]
MQSVAPPVAVSIELLHALVSRVATDAGVRVLLIKGPTLARQGLRAERVSADVDVLVDPGGLPALVGGLRALGWHQRAGAADSPHSVTLVHDQWRGDLDLHRYIPGLVRDPADSFEVLWDRRTQQVFAGHSVVVPDPLCHAVLLALHSLRNIGDPARDTELTNAVQALARADQDEVTAIVRGLGAGYALRGTLSSAGIQVEPSDENSRQAKAWRVRMSPAYGTYIWLMHIREVPWRQKPGAVLRAVWLPTAEIRRNEPDLPAGALPILRARWRRARRGTTALGGIVRARRTRR